MLDLKVDYHTCIYISFANKHPLSDFNRHVNEYPTMHYFRKPRHTQSMIEYVILTEYFWKFPVKNAFWECC